MKISITDFSAPIRASVFKFRDTFRYSKCNVKMKIKMISLFTYDFSTLYTTSPHNLIKDKLIERTFQREGSPYLACNA